MYRLNKLKKSIEYLPRHCVMECAVSLEKTMNLVLAQLLGIDPKNSKALGYKFGSLSFNQKTSLLLDLEEIQPGYPDKFSVFMKIRNKFAHMEDVDSFKKCFEYLGEKEDKKLKSWSKTDINFQKNYEEAYKVAYKDLAIELSHYLSDITIKLIEKKVNAISNFEKYGLFGGEFKAK